MVTESGDCISVEQRQGANIRRVSSLYCEEPDHESLKHQKRQVAAQNDVAEYHSAKEITLAAKAEIKVDIALKKVQDFLVIGQKGVLN